MASERGGGEKKTNTRVKKTSHLIATGARTHGPQQSLTRHLVRSAELFDWRKRYGALPTATADFSGVFCPLARRRGPRAFSLRCANRASPERPTGRTRPRARQTSASIATALGRRPAPADRHHQHTHAAVGDPRRSVQRARALSRLVVVVVSGELFTGFSVADKRTSRVLIGAQVVRANVCRRAREYHPPATLAVFLIT